jgi:hypothetical protein
MPCALFRASERAFVGIHGLCRPEHHGVNRGVVHIASENDADRQRYFSLTSDIVDVSAARR